MKKLIITDLKAAAEKNNYILNCNNNYNIEKLSLNSLKGFFYLCLKELKNTTSGTIGHDAKKRLLEIEKKYFKKGYIKKIEISEKYISDKLTVDQLRKVLRKLNNYFDIKILVGRKISLMKKNELLEKIELLKIKIKIDIKNKEGIKELKEIILKEKREKKLSVKIIIALIIILIVVVMSAAVGIEKIINVHIKDYYLLVLDILKK
jgi:predicted nucleic acid-binding Zn ribbon protein